MTEGEALRKLLEYLTAPGKIIRFAYSEPMVLAARRMRDVEHVAKVPS